MNRTTRIILSIVALIAVAAGGFVGGMFYGKGQAQSRFVAGAPGGAFFGGAPNGQSGRTAGQGTANGAANRGSGVFGEIQQVGDGLLVIKDQNGKETQVKVTDTTLIEKNASVALSDLKAGETVIVSGSKGTDGAITARSVQVAPAGRFGMGQPPAGGQPGGTPAP